MTLEEFLTKWRRHWLSHYAETWGSRKLSPSEFGQMMDRQIADAEKMIKAMFNDLKPAEKTGEKPTVPMTRKAQ